MMTKQRKVIAIMVVVIVVTAWLWLLNKSEARTPDLTLANIEALADGESLTWVTCYVNTITGSSYLVKDCSNCYYSSVLFFDGEYKCWGQPW